MDSCSRSRASLACLSCRRQHLKCDNARPACSRCISLSKVCSYPASRRSCRPGTALSPRREHPSESNGSTIDMTSASHLFSFIGSEVPVVTSDLLQDIISSELVPSESDGNRNIELYYDCFHPSHPFSLPKKALQLRRRTDRTPAFQALVRVMELIGSSYGERNTWHGDLSTIILDSTANGFAVQTLLLMTMAKSMHVEQAAADELLKRTIEAAVELGMHKRTFANVQQQTDPVLAESWRRTWWMIYLTDANFAVIRRDFTTTLSDVDQEVDLPCEDDDYDSRVGIQRWSRNDVC